MRARLIACLTVLASCSQEVETPKPLLETPAEAAPVAVSRTPLLRPASGITIDNNGKRYIWANNVGVQELTPDGWNTILSAQAVQTNTVFDIQDLAVLDDNRIALVAQNEGTVVSRQTAQALNRFCYLPGSLQQQDRTAWQLSRALAFDASENRLYVQPQTFTGFGTEATTSQLGLFDPAISEPLEWQSFSDKNFAAGGMAVVSRQGTYLGAGSKLYRYNAAEKRFDKWWELSGLSISNIEGLAADRTTNTLVVLDGARQELVDLRLDEIQ